MPRDSWKRDKDRQFARRETYHQEKLDAENQRKRTFANTFGCDQFPKHKLVLQNDGKLKSPVYTFNVSRWSKN